MTLKPEETPTAERPPLDVDAVRRDFPIFEQTMRGKPLAFLDSAASAQKPRPVIERLSRFYSDEYASIHRGVYQLSEMATFELLGDARHARFREVQALFK